MELYPLSNSDMKIDIIDADNSVLGFTNSGSEAKFAEDFIQKYDGMKIYPESTAINLGVQYKRGFPILFVDINPTQYDGASKTLTYYTGITLKIKIKKDSSLSLNSMFRGLSSDFAAVGDLVDNPDMINSWKSYGSLSSSEEPEVGNMLIITTQKLKEYSGQYSLSALARAHETKDNNKVYIETVESIYAKYTPVGMPGPQKYMSFGEIGKKQITTNWFETRAENYQIRECIRDYYKNKGVDFVLLVGDDNREWEDDFVFGFFGGPYIRAPKNIVDSNEVPTFQLYLYTQIGWIYWFPIVCDDNNDGPLKKEKDGEIDPIDPDNNGPECDKAENISKEVDSNLSGYPSHAADQMPQSEYSADDGTVSSSGLILKKYNSLGSLAADDPKTPKTPDDGSGCKPRPGGWECFFRKEYTTASDLPYACLDQSGAGDSIIPKPSSKNYPNHFTDLLSEVYVGRAPVDSAKDLENFVKKTIAYINTPDTVDNKVLMVGEYLGFGGVMDYAANSMNELIDGCSSHNYKTVGIPSSDSDSSGFKYTVEKLYEKLGRWSGKDLINNINQGNVNLVNHLGHANVDVNMKLKTPHYNPPWYVKGTTSVNGFSNRQYPIVYSQGCYAGAFDSGPIVFSRIDKTYKYNDGSQMYNDCIAEYLTVKNDAGAVAWIGNSHFGWGMSACTNGPSQRYHREFIDAIFGEGKSYIGMANQDSKEDSMGRIDSWPMVWLYYCLNVIGDPMLKVKGAPFTPFEPTNDRNDDGTLDGSSYGPDDGTDSGDNGGYDGSFIDRLRSFIRQLLTQILANLKSGNTSEK